MHGRGFQQVFNRTGQNRTEQEALHLLQQEARGGNVNASKPYTLKDDKCREDSTVVVQGEWCTGVTELSGSIRLYETQVIWDYYLVIE